MFFRAEPGPLDVNWQRDARKRGSVRVDLAPEGQNRAERRSATPIGHKDEPVQATGATWGGKTIAGRLTECEWRDSSGFQGNATDFWWKCLNESGGVV